MASTDISGKGFIVAELSKLDFTALAALAAQSADINIPCACSAVKLQGWISVPLSLDENLLQDIATLLEDPYADPTFTEFHSAGTRYDSADAPIAPRYFPYNRCNVAQCKNCARHYLRYTEAGGYFVDRRIRLLSARLLVDAPL